MDFDHTERYKLIDDYVKGKITYDELYEIYKKRNDKETWDLILDPFVKIYNLIKQMIKE